MNFFHTSISPRAIALVEETLRSAFVSEGQRVRQFESRLSEQLGLVRPVAVNSGTSALHLALTVAGVGASDEVILPAQTFVATGMAILMQRATPVFADIQPRTGNLDPESVRPKITPRTRHHARALGRLSVRYGRDQPFGRPARAGSRRRRRACLRHSFRGRPVGALSRFTCFSFQAIKHLTTGDGGACAACVTRTFTRPGGDAGSASIGCGIKSRTWASGCISSRRLATSIT